MTSSQDDAETSDRCVQWPSGRALTRAQRDRKRQLNRASAKKNRDEKKKRIEQLEEQLRRLKLNWRTRDRMTVDQALRATPERATEASSLPSPSAPVSEAVNSPVDASLAASEHSYETATSGASELSETLLASTKGPGVDVLPTADISQWQNMSSELLEIENDASSLNLQQFPGLDHVISPDVTVMPNVEPQSSNDSMVLIPKHPLYGAPTNSRATTVFWNNIVVAAGQLDAASICVDTRAVEDFLVRVMLGGWDFAFESTSIDCPLQRLLRQGDDAMLQHIGQMERLTILRCMHNMILHIVAANTSTRQEIWPWYRARPAQLHSRHDPVADFFVWPGVRERLAFYSESVMTNSFWWSFFKNYRFHWPKPFHEAFEFDVGTGTYSICGELMNRMSDIHHWRMLLDFFDEFPAFGDDVLPVESIPQYISLWRGYAEEKRRGKRRRITARPAGRAVAVDGGRLNEDAGASNVLQQSITVDPTNLIASSAPATLHRSLPDVASKFSVI